MMTVEGLKLFFKSVNPALKVTHEGKAVTGVFQNENYCVFKTGNYEMGLTVGELTLLLKVFKQDNPCFLSDGTGVDMCYIHCHETIRIGNRNNLPPGIEVLLEILEDLEPKNTLWPIPTSSSWCQQIAEA